MHFIKSNTVLSEADRYLSRNLTRIFTCCLISILLYYRFAVTISDVSRIFSSTLPILARALKPFIVFYNRVDTRKSLPKEYMATKNLRCTIDCTEVFIQRPSNLKLQAATWSDYKHHNTIKCLVGITPQGSICYVSEFFGGRTSDRVTVTQSKFLDFINPGDQVLADRGFQIREILLAKSSELLLPPAAKGATQMTKSQVEKTKTVANVRIHVERVIRRIKHFRILSQIFPVSLLPHANDILLVCAAITNMHGPIVKSWAD